MVDHEQYMRRCLELAQKGLGMVQPNPMVGSVVVHGGRIIGEGFHTAAGEPHAEVEAIRSVNDKHLLRESTLYVNLEPCDHTGKTPPCTRLIIESAIPRVVVGQVDPNPLVAGGGLQRLQSAGVEVTRGILEAESRFLNRRFNCFHEKKRPYVILKWAETRDGFIDRIRTTESGQPPAWITDEVCRKLVHKWRTEESALLVGAETLIKDNPRLNVRVWSGRNPVRIALGKRLSALYYREVPQTEAGITNTYPYHLLDGTQPTLIFSDTEGPENQNPGFIRIDFGQAVWPQVLNELYVREIQSVIVEGGHQTLQSIIDENLWDEARIFVGPLSFHEGIPAPLLHREASGEEKVGNSILRIVRSDA